MASIVSSIINRMGADASFTRNTAKAIIALRLSTGGDAEGFKAALAAAIKAKPSLSGTSAAATASKWARLFKYSIGAVEAAVAAHPSDLNKIGAHLAKAEPASKGAGGKPVKAKPAAKPAAPTETDDSEVGVVLQKLQGIVAGRMALHLAGSPAGTELAQVVEDSLIIVIAKMTAMIKASKTKAEKAKATK